MDLTDATGRAHAAWWVAGTIGGHVPRLMRDNYRHQKWLSIFIGDTCYVSRRGGRRQREQVVVPALAHLDPTDNTRLPDGSRVVDALALKAVVEYLLAQRSAK